MPRFPTDTVAVTPELADLYMLADNSDGYALKEASHTAMKTLITADSLLKDGSVALTASWDAGSYTITSAILNAGTQFNFNGSRFAWESAGGTLYIGTGQSSNATASNNVVVGKSAGAVLGNTAVFNTLVGYQAGDSMTTGVRNTCIGYRTGQSLTTNSYNVIIGADTGFAQTGTGNTHLGTNAGLNNAGNYNVFIGFNAGYNASGANNRLYIETTDSATPLIYGEFDNDIVRIYGDLQTTGTFKADTITEYTTDAGVTIEGALFEDTTLHLNDTETPALFATATIQAFKNSGVNFALWTASATAATDSDIQLIRSRGTIGSQSAVQDNDFLGSINFVGETDSSNFNNGAQIRAEVNGSVSAGILPCDLVFYTNKGGGATTEAVRIDNNKMLIPQGAVSFKRTASATDYNPSALTTDLIIAITDTSSPRTVTISTEDIQTGSTSNPRIFIIKDESGGAGTNNITVQGESGNIDGAASVAITGNYEALMIYADGTNLWIF